MRKRAREPPPAALVVPLRNAPAARRVRANALGGATCGASAPRPEQQLQRALTKRAVSNAYPGAPGFGAVAPVPAVPNVPKQRLSAQ